MKLAQRIIYNLKESAQDDLVSLVKTNKKEFKGMKAWAFVNKMKNKFPTLDMKQLLTVYDNYVVQL